MADLQPLLPRKILPMAPIGDAPDMPALTGLGSGVPILPAVAPPTVTADPRLSAVVAGDPLATRKSQLDADLYNRMNPVAHPPTTTLGKIGHVASQIGGVLGNIFAPDAMALIPHTQLYNERIMERDKADLAKVSQEQTAEAGRKQTAANTDYLEQKPQIEQAKILQKLTSSLAPKGIKPTMNPDGTIDVEDDPESQAYKNQQALAALHQSTSDKDDALTTIAQNKYQPGTPEYEREMTKIRLAEQTKQIALKSLGLSAARLGFQEDKFYNPQPTASQRNKGDMGNSAVDQIHTMRSILESHPEFQGPGAGATQAFQRWLSSNGEDAGKFLAAKTYLADHSAAVFGGRGEYISKHLESLTDPNFSVSTLHGVLDQAEETANRFTKAGETHSKGGTLQPQQSATPSDAGLPKEIVDAIPEGHQATLSDGSVWKKVGGKIEQVKK